MATMSVISWANLLQNSLLFIHKKTDLIVSLLGEDV